MCHDNEETIAVVQHRSPHHATHERFHSKETREGCGRAYGRTTRAFTAFYRYIYLTFSVLIVDVFVINAHVSPTTRQSSLLTGRC